MGELLQRHVPDPLHRDRPNVINMMPLSVLGAIVIYTGYKLCAPKVWKHVAHIGSEQLFVFLATVLATVTTDLLWGIAVGMLAKFALEILDRGGRRETGGTSAPRREDHGPSGPGRRAVPEPGRPGGDFPRRISSLLRPTLVCFNALHLKNALASIPGGATAVYLHVPTW